MTGTVGKAGPGATKRGHTRGWWSSAVTSTPSLGHCRGSKRVTHKWKDGELCWPRKAETSESTWMQTTGLQPSLSLPRRVPCLSGIPCSSCSGIYLKLQIPNPSRSSLSTLPHSPESMPSSVFPWMVAMHFYSLSLLSTSGDQSFWRPLPTSSQSSHIINLITSLSSYGPERDSHCLQMESQVPTETHLVFMVTALIYHTPVIPAFLSPSPPPPEVLSAFLHTCQLHRPDDSSAGNSQWLAPEFSPTSQTSANSNHQDDFSDASGQRNPCHAVTTLPATARLHFLQCLSLQNDSHLRICSLLPISLHQHMLVSVRPCLSL